MFSSRRRYRSYLTGIRTTIQRGELYSSRAQKTASRLSISPFTKYLHSFQPHRPRVCLPILQNEKSTVDVLLRMVRFSIVHVA